MQFAAEAHVVAASSACGEAAVQNLLGIMCDAVVHLDDTLLVVPPSSELNALVLRAHESAGATAGPHFPSLLSREDEDRFTEFVSRGDSAGKSLHVHMRDHCASIVDAQLFHQRFEDVAGTVRHVIGVLDVSDVPDVQRVPLAVRSRCAASCLHALDSASASGRDGSIGSGSSNGSDLVPLQFSQDDQLVALWRDSATSNLRILSCTAIFTNISGPLEEGAGLLDMVDEGDKASFLRRVQHLVESEDFNEEDDASEFWVRLHTQGIELQTMCQMHHKMPRHMGVCRSLAWNHRQAETTIDTLI